MGRVLSIVDWILTPTRVTLERYISAQRAFVSAWEEAGRLRSEITLPANRRHVHRLIDRSKMSRDRYLLSITLIACFEREGCSFDEQLAHAERLHALHAEHGFAPERVRVERAA